MFATSATRSSFLEYRTLKIHEETFCFLLLCVGRFGVKIVFWVKGPLLYFLGWLVVSPAGSCNAAILRHFDSLHAPIYECTSLQLYPTPPTPISRFQTNIQRFKSGTWINELQVFGRKKGGQTKLNVDFYTVRCSVWAQSLQSWY